MGCCSIVVMAVSEKPSERMRSALASRSRSVRVQVSKQSLPQSTPSRCVQETLVREGESTAKRVFQFLAYVNQRDWRARKLLDLLDGIDQPANQFNLTLPRIEKDYATQNKLRLSKGSELIPESDLNALRQVFPITRDSLSLTRQLDDWVTEFLKDASRVPNDNE